ncbi:kinesin family member 12, partial [Reticulomyxa filosa]
MVMMTMTMMKMMVMKKKMIMMKMRIMTIMTIMMKMRIMMMLIMMMTMMTMMNVGDHSMDPEVASIYQMKMLVFNKKVEHFVQGLNELFAELKHLPAEHGYLDKLMVMATLEYLGINPDEKRILDTDFWDFHQVKFLRDMDKKKEEEKANNDTKKSEQAKEKEKEEILPETTTTRFSQFPILRERDSQRTSLITSEECISPLSAATPIRSTFGLHQRFSSCATPTTTKSVNNDSDNHDNNNNNNNGSSNSKTKPKTWNPSLEMEWITAPSPLPTLSTIGVGMSHRTPIQSEKTVLEEVWECIQSAELIDPCSEKDALLLGSYAYAQPACLADSVGSPNNASKKEHEQGPKPCLEKLCTIEDWKYYMRMQIAPETLDRLGVNLGVDDRIEYCSLEKLRQIFRSCISRRLHAQMVTTLEKDKDALANTIQQKELQITQLTAEVAHSKALVQQLTSRSSLSVPNPSLLEPQSSIFSAEEETIRNHNSFTYEGFVHVPLPKYVYIHICMY